jgi:putative ABC transport system permease protein
MGLELARQIAQLPGVEGITPLRFRKVDFRDTRVFLNAVDAAAFYRIDCKRPTPVPNLDLFRRLGEQPGTAVISDNFAALHGVEPGDTLTLTSPRGPVALQVIGKFPDYTWNLGTILMDRAEYLKHWDDPAVDVFDVYLWPGQDVQAVQETLLRRLGPEYGLFALTRGELTERIDDLIERLYSIAYAQQLVVMLVAALGVVTALLISVLQRRRELGLLRAVGASRGHVVRSVLAEAALMGVLGTAIGLVMGVGLLWYVLKVLILEEAGFLFPLYVPWLEGLVIAGAAVVLATLAGLWPALSTVRQRIPEAIAYE